MSDRFLVAFRLTGDPLYDVVGLTSEDMVEIARRLDALGRIDFFDVSGGTGSTLESQAATVPGDSFAPACYLPLARRMREELRAPVLSAGRILDLDAAEGAIAAGDCDLVAMTRAIIADPDLPRRAQAGEADRIRPCIAINEGCIGRDYQGFPMLCAVNPAINWPGLDDYAAAPAPSRVVVVGGGPAGLEAARVAAERGHGVVLFERSPRVGGQIAVAAEASERTHLARHVQWLERELERLGVDVRLGVEGTVDRVLGCAPDAAVLATGAVNVLPPEAEGVGARCVTDVDVLEGRARIEPGVRVLAFDREGLNRGGSIACRAADAGAGRVELATPLLAVCQEMDPTQQPAMMRRLTRGGVVCTPNVELAAPLPDGRLALRNVWSDEVGPAGDVDLAIFAGYRHALAGLEEELLAARPDLEVRMAGDCIAPRRLHDAVAEGVGAGNAAGGGDVSPAPDGVRAYATPGA